LLAKNNVGPVMKRVKPNYMLDKGVVKCSHMGNFVNLDTGTSEKFPNLFTLLFPLGETGADCYKILF
jgi:hypothetical protein